MSMSVTPAPTPGVRTSPGPRNRRGLVALILGIAAVILALIPFASYGAWLIGIGAVVFGILAVVRPALPKRAGIAGIVLGAVAVILSVILSIVYTVLFIVASTTADGSGYTSRSAGAPIGGNGTTHRVVYSVTGTGHATAIAYYTVNGGQSGQSTLQNQSLPWSKSVTVRGTLTGKSSAFTVVGQHADTGRITCTITLDGKVVATQTSSGKNSTTQCIYRPEG